MDTWVLAILTKQGFVESSAGVEEGPLGLVLGSTGFYAEQGGQVADTGVITAGGARFAVSSAQVKMEKGRRWGLGDWWASRVQC